MPARALIEASVDWSKMASTEGVVERDGAFYTKDGRLITWSGSDVEAQAYLSNRAKGKPLTNSGKTSRRARMFGEPRPYFESEPLAEFAAGAMPPSREDLDTFTRSYIEAALESMQDEDKERFDGSPSIEDIAPATLKQIVADCQKFQTEMGDVLSQAAEHVNFSDVWSQGGYDFYQTRVGAGVGFWEESDWPEPYGPKLDAAAKAFGNVDFYVGDDNLVYQLGAEGDWQLRSLRPLNAKGGLIGSVKVTDTEPPADPDASTFSMNSPEDNEDDEDLRESTQQLVDKLLAEDELEGDVEAEEVICPSCTAVQPEAQAKLGGLGNQVYYRCRYCGMDWRRSG